jgi:hypothetical protein
MIAGRAVLVRLNIWVILAALLALLVTAASQPSSTRLPASRSFAIEAFNSLLPFRISNRARWLRSRASVTGTRSPSRRR